MPPARSYLPRLTLATVWSLLAVTFALLAGELHVIPVADFWWHLRLGQIIWTERQLPTVDGLSFTARGAFAPAVQWLGELYLYLTFALGGLELVLLANALLLATVAALMLLTCREEGAGARVGALVTMAFLFVGVFPSGDARPQVLGFVIFALWYLLLIRYRLRSSPLVCLVPPTAVIWNNANGTVLLGLGLLAVAWVGEALNLLLQGRLGLILPSRKLRGLGVAVVSVPLTMLLNPWGLDLFRYLRDYVTDTAMRQIISEWRPPTVDDPLGLCFFTLLLASVACFALSPRRLDLAELLVFLAFTALAIQAGRNSVWFAIVAAPLVAGRLQSILDLWPRAAEGPEHVGVNYVLAGVFSLLNNAPLQPNRPQGR